jgi:beta-glucosidase-like glycosyl hydrolase
MQWSFGPCVAVARDERWGLTYESWGESPELQRLYAAAYVRGQLAHLAQGFGVLGSAKHFLGDGGYGAHPKLPEGPTLAGRLGLPRARHFGLEFNR